MKAEHNLGKDAQWKQIQQNTFTRWANEHLKTVGSSIDNLETDLSDGLRLIALVEVLAHQQLPAHNKRPTFRSQKLENVSIALKFLQDEGIKIVNIDSSDIVDGKLKLILGLIWTLILHYSISLPVWEGEDEKPLAETGQTPKQRLMAWIQMKIPDMSINNFTKDWTTGKPVGALVDACAPGLCPDWELWDPNDSVANATEAMTLADDWLDVRQLITPEELVDPNVDEQSVMTYLAQYPNCKLKEGAPLRPKTDPNSIPLTPVSNEPLFDNNNLVEVNTYTTPEVNTVTEIDGLHKGANFLIAGKIAPNADGFSINFVCNNEERDIPLHINPRFQSQLVVRNSQFQGSWGTEETHSDGPFPFDQGETFTVQVLVTDYCYLIALNGHYVEQYVHRQSFESVQFIEVNGDVENVRMYRSEIRGYPHCFPELAPPSDEDFDILPMDYSAVFTAKVDPPSEGDNFLFSGRIDDKCQELEINFFSLNETRDIPLNIKSRFVNNEIICNSRIGNEWNVEEVSSPTPFHLGDQFAVQVLVTRDSYLIAINGRHYGQFTHRLPFSAVALLEVKGGIYDVKMLRNTVRDYPQSILQR